MRIVVGLSGGVDSSVAAHLLQKAGHEVIAVFMKNWNDADPTLEDECPWVEDSIDAMLVAEKLGIPFQVVDLSKEYKERIVDYMFYEYEKGRTPNPDVLCNREVKFDLFLKIALDLGAEGVATGHYCRKETLDKNGNKIYRLLSGKDKKKDQSYFLCQLTQEQLSYSHFPIGEMQKLEVRALAKKLDLTTSDKKDSQGLCFIGKVDLPTFLQQQLKIKKGKIIEILNDELFYEESLFENNEEQEKLESITTKKIYKPEQGKVIGSHNGAYFFTKGQRKGIGIGGRKEPLFVLDTDVDENILYVGEGKNHQGLYRKGLFMSTEETRWIRTSFEPKIGEKLTVSARIRYRQELQEATFIRGAKKNYLIFKKPQFAIAEGQFAAWYIEDELIGSGVIS